MAYLKGFGLENFRVFKDYTWFDFAPITLLVGPNNSGKSSLIKALLLLKDNYENGKLKGGTLKFDGPLHNLSSGISVVNNLSAYSDFSFYVRCDIPALVQPVFKKINCRNVLNETFFNSNELTLLDGTLFFSQNYSDQTSKRVVFDLKKFISLLHSSDSINDALKYTRVKEINSHFGAFDKHKQDMDRYIQKDHINYLNKRFINFSFYNFIKEVNISNIMSISDLFDEVKSKIEYKSDISDLLVANDLFDKEEILRCSKIIDNLLFCDSVKHSFDVFNHLIYLPSVKGQTRRWYSNGEDEILNRLFKDYLRLHLSNKEITVDVKDPDYKQAKWVNKFVSEWAIKFGLSDLKVDKNDNFNINFVEANRLSFADQGYGLTQIAALLLNIHNAISTSSSIHSDEPYYFASSKIVLLEEPESNLHPKFQSMLADMLLEAATSTKENAMGVQFVIETHSEYLTRKFQYLVAKGEMKSDDIVIHYFHDPNNIPAGEKQVKKINILEDGSLSDDFGPGFYDEAATWELELLKLKKTKVRQN